MDKTPSETLSEMEANMERAKAFIAKFNWVFAKTYADKAPHEYTILKKCPPELLNEWDWFCGYIREFGYPEKFYTKTFYYINIGLHKYWSMELHQNPMGIINRTDCKRIYR